MPNRLAAWSCLYFLLHKLESIYLLKVFFSLEEVYKFMFKYRFYNTQMKSNKYSPHIWNRVWTQIMLVPENVLAFFIKNHISPAY